MHSCINNRVSSFSFTPRLKKRFILIPNDVAASLLKFLFFCFRKVKGNMLPKFSPCKFRDKYVTYFYCLIINLSDREYSETYIGREERSSINIKNISLSFIVFAYVSIQSRFSKFHRKKRVFFYFYKSSNILFFLYFKTWYVKYFSFFSISNSFFPKAKKGSEDLSLRDFFRFNKQIIRNSEKRKICFCLNIFIAKNSIISITSVSKYGFYTILFNEFRNKFFWTSIEDLKSFSSSFLYLTIKLKKGFTEKSKFLISKPKKKGKEVSIKDKNRENLFWLFESFFKSSVIINSEVLSEPKDTSLKHKKE